MYKICISIKNFLIIALKNKDKSEEMFKICTLKQQNIAEFKKM